jgi:hypothetical protein
MTNLINSLLSWAESSLGSINTETPDLHPHATAVLVLKGALVARLGIDSEDKRDFCYPSNYEDVSRSYTLMQRAIEINNSLPLVDFPPLVLDPITTTGVHESAIADAILLMDSMSVALSQLEANKDIYNVDGVDEKQALVIAKAATASLLFFTYKVDGIISEMLSSHINALDDLLNKFCKVHGMSDISLMQGMLEYDDGKLAETMRNCPEANFNSECDWQKFKVISKSTSEVVFKAELPMCGKPIIVNLNKVEKHGEYFVHMTAAVRQEWTIAGNKSLMTWMSMNAPSLIDNRALHLSLLGANTYACIAEMLTPAPELTWEFGQLVSPQSFIDWIDELLAPEKLLGVAGRMAG